MAIGDVYHLLDYRAGRKGNLDVFTGDETKVFEKCEVCRVDGGDKEGVGLYFERKNIIEAGCFFGKEGNSVMLDGVARKVNYSFMVSGVARLESMSFSGRLLPVSVRSRRDCLRVDSISGKID